jgi:uncharacterized phage protein (TIGR02218 family)
LSYDLLEASVAEGRPLFLYRFAEGAEVWRFTSRAADWSAPAGAVAGEATPTLWAARAIGHGAVVQSGDPRRVDLSVTLPLSDAFARRFLGLRPLTPATLTIHRGHEQAPGETVAHWKGRVVSARVAGETVTLACESLFTTLRREGARARYQRLCRHALYGPGCGVALEAFLTPATVTGRAGRSLTVPEAAARPDGWWRGGVIRHDGRLGAIADHAGPTLTLASGMPELEAALAAGPVAPASVAVAIAPGCDLRAETCRDRFDNLANHGGFPFIPGRNPFGGGSVV